MTRAALMAGAEMLAARAHSESTLNDRPDLDTRVLAVGYLGCSLAPRDLKPGTAYVILDENRIHFSVRETAPWLNWIIGHESGHVMVRAERWQLGRDNEEAVADRFADAVTLPRRPFLRDVREVGRDVERLAALWTVPAEVVARRLEQLRA